MYRVVLIDDERLIVEGLSRVVKWADYGCEVAATAEDMPGQDGLTMLAGLRSEFPDMQVTVLTGYRDFSYAQEAIRLGVTRFLLKPSKMDEINEALSAMTEHLKKKRPDAEEESQENNRAGSFLVKQAVAYMEAHYAEKLTLQEVADACYVSQWHLSKLLNRFTEQSFYDILNSQRVEAAKKLLADPSLRIGDIGEMVGYADPAHFARIFKKTTGMSANEYRNSL